MSDTPTQNPTRELAAIMFSDIAGYTAIMAAMSARPCGQWTISASSCAGYYRGSTGEWPARWGDATLSSFHSALDAVNCALAAQAAQQDDPQQLRIGIHLSDVVFSNNTVLGDGVNVASRIHALASPGAICISAKVYDQIRNKPEFQVGDLGEQKLKNVDRPIRVYALAATRLPEQPRTEQTCGCSKLGLVGLAPRVGIIKGGYVR